MKYELNFTHLEWLEIISLYKQEQIDKCGSIDDFEAMIKSHYFQADESFYFWFRDFINREVKRLNSLKSFK